MAKEIIGLIKLQIPAGGANPSPPVGPALGQRGLNIMDFCKAFNDKTKNLEKGAPIPVIITAYKDRSFDFITKLPPVSYYLKKAAKAAKLHKDKMACNKPRKTPGHKTKSHVVKACDDGKEKIVRFGQQGVKGAGKSPKTAKDKARKKSYYARHDAQDSSPDKMSARYWSHKVKW